MKGWIFLLILIGMILTIFYLVSPYMSDSSPVFPKGCLEHYPFNITFEGQSVYTRFYNPNKCCSATLLPATIHDATNYNVCWERNR